MDAGYMMDEVEFLAKKCILLGYKKRPELEWVKEKYEYIQEKYALKNKTETDRFLYEKMHGLAPEKSTEFLKIRYWRTGKYVPGSREQCLLFGKALELSVEELRFMMQGYCDRSEDIYATAESQRNKKCCERKAYLRKIVKEYIRNVPKEKLESLRVPEEKAEMFLRHLYFTDAFQYVELQSGIDSDTMRKHISSYRYQSEFARQMQLRGEIPRKVFIRHLLILGLPELTLEKLDRQLQFFGYLGLNEEHTMVRGERLDWLLIRVFEMYEELLGKYEREVCLRWFQKACRTLDRVFREEGHPRLRFMYFKALKV